MRIRNFDEEKSILYLVATPIGNMKEMSPRALEILNSVSIVGCEDTRNSGKLLSYFGINKKLISCHEHNEEQAIDTILKYLDNCDNVSYISDAGYPGISDPGERLVRRALDANYKVSVVSGSNAMLLALLGSGLDTTHFYFHGFLASKHSVRIKELEKLKDKEETLIFYESPHRIKDTLSDLLLILGNRKACIARELTKKFEEYIRDDLENLNKIDEDTLIGEMVIIIDGKKSEDVEIDINEVTNYAIELVKNGYKTKDAAKNASEKYQISKNIIYNNLIEALKK